MGAGLSGSEIVFTVNSPGEVFTLARAGRKGCQVARSGRTGLRDDPAVPLRERHGD